MSMKYGLLFLTCLLSISALTAQKKQLDHVDVMRWRKIEQSRISNDGQWVAYVTTPNTEGDPELQLWRSATEKSTTFRRATDVRFSEDNKILVFRIKPPLDTLKAQRRRKVKDDDLPKDTLAIYTLATGHLEKIARIKNWSMPEKWAGWLAYQLEPEKPAPAKKDTTAKTAAPDSTKTAKPVEKKKSKKPKKEDKDNGYRLYMRNTDTGKQDTFAYIQQYALAKKGKRILLYSTGKGDTLTWTAHPDVLQNGIYRLDLEQSKVQTLFRGKGKFQQLSLDDSGAQAAFLADLDTTKARIRPWQLYYAATDTARLIRETNNVCHAFDSLSYREDKKRAPSAVRRPPSAVSENYKPVFSENGESLYFGVAPAPILPDTSLLPEEIVNVEVWTWTDNRIYTEQKNKLDAEKKRAYPAVWHIRQNRFSPLATTEIPELRFQDERNAALALGFNEEPYAKYITSEGTVHRDLYAVDVPTGTAKRIVTDLRCKPQLSPGGQYIAWWSDRDSAWFSWNARTGNTARLTNNHKVRFYKEDNDLPDYPDDYGMAGWFDGDASMLVYDRYDIWKIDPNGKLAPERLTEGRETRTVNRYIRLDPDEHSISPKAPLMLHQFNDSTKEEYYARLNLSTGIQHPLLGGDYALARQPQKAKHSEGWMFTRESFGQFPDLHYAGGRELRQISWVNPQQSEYRWGTIEPVQWTAASGLKMNGMLVKPEGFDPTRRYPMIVNFYEKQSDDINKHRAPDFGRSQINYVFYASRGYLVFIPDIVYRTGYPGECAYDAIVSGVTALMDKGFVDPKRIALQGHSWGGYQTAYLVTRTNLFACAEAGAPVANMTSAYGGIRWETGISRAFQYEHQQSRIGGTLWEYPLRYIENSPLFALDKVQTPLLILHNDKDGAVPWQQGIELFSGLRRLGKPAWMLNYNDEPHWPVKLQNRIDFQKRMQQFFDYYLMGGVEPRWMVRGVPPAEKGVLQGYEGSDE
jgi:dipeptidyl aminopeptidase/acylaminoacyl peptidase